MSSIEYSQLWQAEAAAGGLVQLGYRRRTSPPRPGECRVVETKECCTLEWEPFVWDELMLRRIYILDSRRSSDVREARASIGSELEALRVLSIAFPDRKRAEWALEQLEKAQRSAA